MAMCLRYFVGANLREDFLGFAECESTTGETLSNAFLANLELAGVDVNKMRGQGYDGAANMSGIRRGVQARIQQRILGAVYTHCKVHCLNLAIIHASKEMYARNMMATVQQIAFAINYYAKRLLRFQENLDNDEVARVEMDKRTKLQSLCETRLAARADALHTFLCLFRVVVSSLDELASDYGDSKATGYSRLALFRPSSSSLPECLSNMRCQGSYTCRNSPRRRRVIYWRQQEKHVLLSLC
ncbi:zinc finger MYM-type protein 1-like [Mya arenaria]|uniref:zinc finger MYM-type protein 1-like n=1 Tax=Mya arenaria TaxID=6604 RepID=UPI0022E1D123|nr:zinc finger MYM-type protein 1-like [Mya arenaria]